MIVQRLEWWAKEQFVLRYNIHNPVCDRCNNDLDEFPAVIVGRVPDTVRLRPDGSIIPNNSGHALCSSCRQKQGISEGDQEYFETMAYNTGEEPRKLGINCGGR